MTPRRRAFLASFASAVLVTGVPAVVLLLLYGGMLDDAGQVAGLLVTALSWAAGGGLLASRPRRSLAGVLTIRSPRWAHRNPPRAARRQPSIGATAHARVPPMDYPDDSQPAKAGSKLEAEPGSIFKAD